MVAINFCFADLDPALNVGVIVEDSVDDGFHRRGTGQHGDIGNGQTRASHEVFVLQK